MHKTLRKLLLIYLICTIQFNLEARPSFNSELDLCSISYLKTLQEKESEYVKKYLELTKLYDAEDYTKSLRLTLNLLNEIKNKHLKELEYLCNFLIGKIFSKRNDHDKSLDYFKRALSSIQKFKHIDEKELKRYGNQLVLNKSIARTLLLIGVEYFKLNKKDSAAIYFKRIVETPFLGDYSEIMASGYTNLTGIYLGESNFDLAKEYALKAIDLHNRNNHKIFEASSLNNLASIYLVEKEYLKAKEVYSKAIDLIKFDESIDAIKTKEDLYYNLAYILYMQKDYKAYDYLEQSYVFKDTITDREIRRIVKGVYAEYQEQYKVETLKNKVALEEAESRKTNWFLGALMLLTLGISGTILYNYKLRQNNLKLKLTQTELSQKNKLEKLKSDSQIRILNATIDGKETERKQIAETLHDSVSSLLSSANLHLQATKMQFNGDTPIEITKTQKIIIEASQTIRDLSHTLVSSVLLKFGLNYAIKDMAEKYSNSQITMETEVLNVGRFHQSFEIKVYNIVHELVNNILKHSNAKRAIVRMKDVGNLLTIEIQDNGDGFDKEVIPEKDGLGINQIDARIQMMKGTFFIDSTLNKGTKISVTLPVFEKDAIVNA